MEGVGEKESFYCFRGFVMTETSYGLVCYVEEDFLTKIVEVDEFVTYERLLRLDECG